MDVDTIEVNSSSDESDKLFIHEENADEIPLELTLPTEVKATHELEPLMDDQEGKASKRKRDRHDEKDMKKRVKEKKERQEKKKDRQEKQVKQEKEKKKEKNTEKVPIMKKASCSKGEEKDERSTFSPPASTSGAVIMSSPVASTSKSQDMFDDDETIDQFLLSQTEFNEELLKKVKNSEELGVSNTPKTQSVLNEEQRLSAHINQLIDQNTDSEDPINRAWANLSVAEKRALSVINRFNGSKAKGAKLRISIANFNTEEMKMNYTVLRDWKNCLYTCMGILKSQQEKPNLDKISIVFYKSEMAAVRSAIGEVKGLEVSLQETEKMMKEMCASFTNKFEEKLSAMAKKAIAIKTNIKGIKSKFTDLAEIDFRPPSC